MARIDADNILRYTEEDIEELKLAAKRLQKNLRINLSKKGSLLLRKQKLSMV